MITLFDRRPVPRDEFGNLGFASPRATAITLMWAVVTRNAEVILQCFAPEIVPNLRQEMADPDAFWEKTSAMYNKIIALHLLAAKKLESGDIALKFTFEISAGQEIGPLTHTFHDFDGQWKFIGSTRDADW